MIFKCYILKRDWSQTLTKRRTGSHTSFTGTAWVSSLIPSFCQWLFLYLSGQPDVSGTRNRWVFDVHQGIDRVFGFGVWGFRHFGFGVWGLHLFLSSLKLLFWTLTSRPKSLTFHRHLQDFSSEGDVFHIWQILLGLQTN